MFTIKEKDELLNVEQEIDREVLDTVKNIIEDVRHRGDDAVKEYTERYDDVRLGTLTVSNQEIEESYRSIPKVVLKALNQMKNNIELFHKVNKPVRSNSAITEGIETGILIKPYSKVACYIPSGTAAYPSTVLMTVVPAKIAGVETIIVVTPPQKDGRINPYIAATAKMLEISQIYKIGGAQAIAALAYGTETIPRVDKIVGPGNIYVTVAKKIVAEKGLVAIDFFAGPSEVLIIADDTANPKYIAHDIVAQAEHDKNARCVLVTTNEGLINQVKNLVLEIVQGNPRKEIIEYALKNNGGIVLCKDIDECIDFANKFAPEHLQIITNTDEYILNRINNAGSIFLGKYTPVALGDYASGTNHVLPTAGYAKFTSGLNIDSFVKKITWQRATKKGLNNLKEVITKIAELESLPNHANSVNVRFEENID